MQKGRPPTPTNLHILRGNPSKKALNKDPQPTRPNEIPAPPLPIALEPYAAEEWSLVAAELWRLGLYTVCDKGALCAYCFAYAEWRHAAEIIHDLRANDPKMRGLLVKGRDGAQAVQNPLAYMARKAASDMVRYASEFGFTPAARSRIAAGVDNQEERSFAGLLA